ncbi:Membrane protein involved in the export of O-antigen and teichoic acid [Granulicatella balaenopterae]|uniref:Membrane protein involved in the export of O-antigen and teichoic acid n=1 Tax=Granulicatella balaenopterae TaxID=137733 RepID=A0A1H9I5L3_9LACT|nr:oligosaccharide flippase family protein [Granulicatella balaenopterae]SEQ69802.1 Membrane protein involved in the export of O-antigen and teichoic acid [Granulicatella balaenopterae]
MKDIRANAFANMLVKLLNIVFPLITTAYLSRVLSKPLYGEFNIANTYLNLFVPFATFGVYNYGIREISKVKDNKDKINHMFSALFYVSVGCTLITTLLFLGCIPLYTASPNVRMLIYILTIQLVSQMFYIEWMNEAFEDYSFIFYKTFIFRIIMLVSIFMFVKKSDDIMIYALILSLSHLGNYLASFIWIKRSVKFVKVKLSFYKRLYRPLIGLFLLANANMLYTLLDRTFIARVGIPEDVSNYTNGQNIVMLIVGVVGGAVSVSVPRLGYYLGKRDHEAYRELIYKGSRWFSLAIAPIGMGLAVLGTQATVLMYSDKYVAGGIVTTIFAIRTISWAIEILLGTQVILINGFENKLTKFYFVGGAMNFMLNSLLYANGMANPAYYVVTTILSEYVVIFLEYSFIRNAKLLDVKPIFATFAKYASISLGFVPISLAIKYLYPVEMSVSGPFLLSIVMIIIACVIYYVAVLWMTKDEMFIQAQSVIKEKLA